MRRGTNITVEVDAPGRTAPVLLSGAVPIASWSWLTFDLDDPLPAGEVRVRLKPPTFVPAQLWWSADTRSLGIGMRALEVSA